jgi:hypothetical protein
VLQGPPASIRLGTPSVCLVGLSPATHSPRSVSLRSRKDFSGQLSIDLSYKHASQSHFRIARSHRAGSQIRGLGIAARLLGRVCVVDQRSVVVWRLSSGRASGSKDICFLAGDRARGVRGAAGRVSCAADDLHLPIFFCFFFCYCRDMRLGSDWCGADGGTPRTFSARIRSRLRIYRPSSRSPETG